MRVETGGCILPCRLTGGGGNKFRAGCTHCAISALVRNYRRDSVKTALTGTAPT